MEIEDKEYSIWNNDTGKFLTIPEMDKLCSILKEKFSRQVDINNTLAEENKKLKNEIWEHEEISRLKEENEKLRTELRYGFGITKEEHERINEWISKREKKYTGTIGGRYEYRFFPTGIGTIGTIVDTSSNEKFTFCDLD